MRPAIEMVLAFLLLTVLLPIPLVSGEVATGSRITFSEVATGTTFSITDLQLEGNPATDVVVLDATLWLMYRASDHSRVAIYHPQYSSASWNISFEAYAPRTGNSYINMDPGRIGLKAMIAGSSGSTLGVELCVGNESSEGIFLIEGGRRQLISSGILPSYPSGNTSDGGRPDRYIVSFESTPGEVQVVIRHTVAGIILARSMVFSANAPVIEFFANSEIKMGGAAPYIRSVNGGWMLDDLTVRAAGSQYPTIPQVWCSVDQGAPVAVELLDAEGRPFDASVRIGGHAAQRRGSSYEAFYERAVDWSVPTVIDVESGPAVFKERLLVTTTCSVPGARVATWWGGWDWASVLATDDCIGFETVASVYQGFDHPLTAYIMSPSGTSGDILPTQSELAMHMPHDFIAWKQKDWREAVDSAQQTHGQMNEAYAFASRWDDPSYVGRGDTYISLANPGSAATYEIMFAQYLAGTRIEGASSNQGDTVPGNYSLYGSWWVNNAPWYSVNHSWQPARPIDMMDAQRQFSSDNNNAPWAVVKQVAADGGLLRVYNHRSSNPMQPEAASLMRWIVDPKTDFEYENWKATDGEAASYVYARQSTAVGINASMPFAYDVQRQDPQAAGYWLVPVTISIDLLGRDFDKVRVVEHRPSGDQVHDLAPLNGGRVMDSGYDVRNGTLYVSDFFNASATIMVVSSPPYVVPDAPTGVEAIAGNANATLNWTAPAFDGGSPVDYYVVYQDGVALDVRPTGTSATIVGLTNGQSYSFTVAAHNLAGNGARSIAASATPFTVPYRPTGLAAGAGNAQATLSWIAPAFDGGSPVDYYVVYQNGIPLDVRPTGTSATIVGLINGQSYLFAVAAHNGAGNSVLSEVATVIPYTIPGAPTLTIATPGVRSVLLSWMAPASNGGAAIIGYKIFYGKTGPETQFGDTLPATTLTVRVTGLTDDTLYYFAVKAVNIAGDSSYSNVRNATTNSVPGMPTELGATAIYDQVTLIWNAPSSTGGAPITHYNVYRGLSPSFMTYLGNSTTTAYVDAAASSGTTYYYLVSAVNGVGEGVRSSPFSILVPSSFPATGKIVDINGNGLPRITVALETGISVQTDAKGNFSIMASPGNHTMTISGQGIDTKSMAIVVGASGLVLGNISTTKATDYVPIIAILVAVALLMVVALVIWKRKK